RGERVGGEVNGLEPIQNSAYFITLTPVKHKISPPMTQYNIGRRGALPTVKPYRWQQRFSLERPASLC
ncbi:MAG: hypothetical protein SGI73_20700, partial [Chloroflexota bacterium]|nr:hypothetical protein [Chloroflexota bacterium]